MDRFILGIDIGLTFLKSVIYDLNGNLISESRKQTPIALNTGEYSEIDMNKLWSKVKIVIKESILISKIKAEQIAGIGVSGHGNGLYFTDKNGNAIGNAVTSMDHRSANVVNGCLSIEDKLREKTLQSIWDGQPGMILKWMKVNNPDLYERIGFVMLCKDWITYKLTGEITTDYSDSSGCGLLDNVAGIFNPEILEMLDINEIWKKLPRLLKSYEISGYITEKTGKETDLKKGTPVIAGLFDVDACGIGAGLEKEDQFCSIAGTWNINMSINKNPVKSSFIRQCTLRGDNSSYLMIDSSPTSSSNIDWVLNNISKNKISYKEFEIFLSKYKPENNKVVFLPLVYGGLKKDNSGGMFSNLRSFNNYKDMMGSVAEGICFAHKYHINNLRKSGSNAETVRLTGGASKNAFWCQMFSDVTNYRVEIPESPQTGTLGLCIMVSIGTGIYKNIKEAISKMVRVKCVYEPRNKENCIYSEKYAKFIDILEKSI
jgi:L-xylulokinase